MKIDQLAPNSWAAILFEGYKTHFCSSELVGDLVADIESRGGVTDKVKEVVTSGADLPGIVLVNSPWEEIALNNFKLCFPTQDFEHFMMELESSPLRKFSSGREYHKIHGWIHCIVFTPEQRVAVLKTMEEMLPEVRAKREEVDKEFLRAMEKVNEDKLCAMSWREFALRATVPPKDRN
jgi:hypothetical protein